MQLDVFREKIKYYRLLTDFSQKELARQVGLHPVVFSYKLHGSPGYSLGQSEIKQIIKTLAEWEALTKQSEALELLELGALRPHVFAEEWYSYPLDKLEQDALLTISAIPGATSYLPASKSPPIDARNLINSTNLSNNLPKPFDLATLVSKLPDHNIPSQTTNLIGRQFELNQAQRLLQRADIRLLTLTGAGGVGKTRLALQLAAKMLEDFEHGVFFVPLVPLRDATLVEAVIANAFGLKSSGTTPILEILKRHLSSKHLLLILDNFEHLLEAAPLVGDLLAAAPRLKILTTSRTLLQVYGEHLYSVPPLRLPDLQTAAGLTTEELVSSEAVALFIQRARSAKADFPVVDKPAALLIAQICSKLDGLPLALELAAARCRMFTPQQLLNRLNSHNRLNVLINGAKDKPLHQQTLASTIEWSYNLLELPEQSLLNRLAIFSGSASLEAIQNVCAADKDEIELFEALESLLNKSLIRVGKPDQDDKKVIAPATEQAAEESSADPPLRFSMLETIREYALARLEKHGEISQELLELQTRHLAYFARLANVAEDDLRGARQIERFNELKPDFYNLSSAVNFALGKFATSPAVTSSSLALTLGQSQSTLVSSQPAPLTAADAEILKEVLKLAASFWYFRALSDYPAEGRMWIAKIIRQSKISCLGETADYAKATKWAAIFAITQSDYSVGIEFYTESARVGRLLDDKLTLATSLLGLGVIAKTQGRFEEACHYIAEAVDFYRQAGDKAGLARGLNNYGNLLVEQGDYQQALQIIEEGTMLRREAGDKAGLANSLSFQAGIYIVRTDYAKAQALFEEALVIHTEIGNKWPIGAILHNLCNVFRLQGDFIKARQIIDKAYELAEDLDFPAGFAVCTKYFGYLAYHQQDYEVALEQLEKSLALARKIDYTAYITDVLLILTQVYISLGAYSEAQAYCQEAFISNREAGNKVFEVRRLELSAQLAWRVADFGEAISKLAAASVMRAKLGAPYDPYEKPLYETLRENLKKTLGEEAFKNAWPQSSGEIVA